MKNQRLKKNHSNFFGLYIFYIFVSRQLVGGVHKLNEINSLIHLHIKSHKVSRECKQTVEIIKMMFAIGSAWKLYGRYYMHNVNVNVATNK